MDIIYLHNGLLVQLVNLLLLDVHQLLLDKHVKMDISQLPLVDKMLVAHNVILQIM